MTSRPLGAGLSVTRSEELSDLAARTTLATGLSVGAGTWRVVAVVSDPLQSSTQVVEGTGTLTVDVDHMTMRQDSAVTVTDSVTLFRQDAAEWVPVAATPPAPQTIAARPSADMTMPLGVHTYAAEPGVWVDPDPLPIDTWLDLMPTGIDLVRLGIPWILLQPSSASFDSTWAAYFDGVLADIDARGCKVVLTLGGTPAWARAGGTTPIDPPTDPADFAQWVDAALDRWASTVEIVSIDPWNEANYGVPFWTGTDADYLGLLRATHTAAAGRVPVSLGCIAYADFQWVADLIALGLTGDDFDSIDIHPYTVLMDPPRWLPPHLAVQPVADRKASVACGIHMIEQQLATIDASGRPYIISETGGGAGFGALHGIPLTEARMADWHTTLIDQARRGPVAALAFHEAIDQQDDPANSGGFVDSDYNRRAKWYALDAAL